MTFFIVLGVVAIVAIVASIAAIRTAAIDGYHREPVRVPSQ